MMKSQGCVKARYILEYYLVKLIYPEETLADRTVRQLSVSHTVGIRTVSAVQKVSEDGAS
jgi:hypothetical protein